MPNLINRIFKDLFHKSSLSVTFVYQLYHLHRLLLRKLHEFAKHDLKKDLRNRTLHKVFLA